MYLSKVIKNVLNEINAPNKYDGGPLKKNKKNMMVEIMIYAVKNVGLKVVRWT